MRTAIVILASLLLHAGFVVAGLFYFPHAVNQFTTSQIVPLEFIDDIAPMTNLPEEEEEEEFVEEEAPAPVPEEEAEPETPPEPEIDLQAAPETEPEPEVEDTPVEVAAETPEPEVTRQPETTPQPARTQNRDTLDDLLGDLANVVDEERSSSPSRNQNRGAQSSEAIGVTLADSIRSQAQRCYRSSIDAPDPERLIVVVRVRLNRDGSLDGQPDILNRQAIDASGDRYWRVARDRARAAIADCAPYRLPAEHYSIWRRIDVTFRQET
ncbi:hypothetical protein V0U79_05990 [Hyphobacterium sp. HN65]|uniref:Energy transducer TonB n=1 Tax=Hyphobacterium lacteum TaxID=3116575 RepID=A0ABU7LQN7_9PROT|nr:hypothetical protein [Hyphobacterium sp. HN65]MEE2525909.1 hypothetical protein [Hyphobacterium sp. HN65]